MFRPDFRDIFPLDNAKQRETLTKLITQEDVDHVLSPVFGFLFSFFESIIMRQIQVSLLLSNCQNEFRARYVCFCTQPVLYYLLFLGQKRLIH